MNSNQIRNLWVALIAVAIIAIVGWFTPAGQLVVERAGAITGVSNYDNLGVLSLKVGSGCNGGNTYPGCTGTKVSKVLRGTGSLIGSPSIAATSSAPMDIAVTGVVAGDNVFVSMATTSRVSTGVNWLVCGASASSTSGFITVNVCNNSGIAGIPPIGATSSLQYWIVD
jgi:hypothetical protein